MSEGLGFALVSLHLARSTEEEGRANTVLASVLDRLAQPNAEPAATERSEELDAQNFPTLPAILLHRIIGLYGRGAAPADRRIAPEIDHRARDIFRTWSAAACRLADADLPMIWQFSRSENLDLRRVAACWAAAEVDATEPDATAPGAGRRYADGSTTAEQRTAWSAYLRAFIRAHASGGLTEYFSPTYSKYTLAVFYNLLDLAEDSELKTLAQDFVTLWWARWAEEQNGGVHGGSKARFRTRIMMTGTLMDGVYQLYFDYGDQRVRLTAPNLPLLVTRYRVPRVVREIATAPRNGSYEVWSRELGLATGSRKNGRSELAPDLAVTRYAFVTPSYVMGASLMPRLDRSRWIAMHSLWHGVTLTDAPNARVYATADPVGRLGTFNGTIATQSRGTQIVQRVPPPLSSSAGDMRIWISPRLRRVERDGWIFVAGSAWVAVRAAFGGAAAAPEGTYVLSDSRSPVIIQAATREQFGAFEDFQTAVLAAPLRVTPDWVEFEGLDGAGRLRFHLQGERVAERDDRPIKAPDGWTIYSPFVRQRLGERIVEINGGDERIVLNFDLATR